MVVQFVVHGKNNTTTLKDPPPAICNEESFVNSFSTTSARTHEGMTVNALMEWKKRGLRKILKALTGFKSERD